MDQSGINSDINDVESPALLGLMAGALVIVAIAAAIIGLISDNSALALIPAGVALLLGGAAIWMNATISRLNRKVRSMDRQIIQMDAGIAGSTSSLSSADAGASTSGAAVSGTSGSGRARPPLATPAGIHEGLDISDTSDLADPETGLLGERYFVVTLSARVAAARRHLRPLALVLLEAVKDASTNPESLDPPASADIIRETLRDADTLCRLQNGQFAILLEDTPENGAIWTVERIRRRLAEQVDDATIWAGIACYPANGFDGAEVLDRARSALSSAREWRQDRTEVAEA